MRAGDIIPADALILDSKACTAGEAGHDRRSHHTRVNTGRATVFGAAAPTGGKEDGGCVAFQMAEVAILRQIFQEILRLIAKLRPQPPPAPA